MKGNLARITTHPFVLALCFGGVSRFWVIEVLDNRSLSTGEDGTGWKSEDWIQESKSLTGESIYRGRTPG